MNETTRPIPGIHHITAIASSAAENLRFYTNVLGLRLVKKTVNFDDPYTYHLYFGDRAGTPGTILTFFPWENMPPGKDGAGAATAVAFAVPNAAVPFWSERLEDRGIKIFTEMRFKEPVLRFKDPHGLSLELVGTERKAAMAPWAADGIPARHAISGFHSATATVHDARQPRRALETLLGLQPLGSEGNRIRFAMADPSAAGSYYDLVEDRAAPPARQGGGTVHHIAFRTPDDRDQKRWRERIVDSGFDVTPVIDRNYFHSIYFREPGGVLFEIATDPPGFTVDETESSLGSELKLPKRYEARRSEIEKRLPPIDAATDFRHLFVAPESGEAVRTLVALHGTGGDEKELVSLARRIGGIQTAVLSPRGKLRENGVNRFFRRHAEGVFDQQDLRRQALALADFILESAHRYRLDTSGLAAMGYSNGANIAAAVMLLRPEIFTDAILFRPMMPLDTETLPDLAGRRVLVTRGKFDDVIPAESTRRLVRSLDEAGAQVAEVIVDADHRLTAGDVKAAETWWSNCAAERCAISL